MDQIFRNLSESEPPFRPGSTDRGIVNYVPHFVPDLVPNLVPDLIPALVPGIELPLTGEIRQLKLLPSSIKRINVTST